MSPIEEFEALAATMRGLPISHVWRGYGSAIFIEFGKLSPRSEWDGSPGHAEGEVSLGVEWSWRLENNTNVLCGSWSEDVRCEPALDLLRHAHVDRCELFGALPEVAVTIESGIRFLSFTTTDGQPRWHLIDRRGGTARWFFVREGQVHLGDGTERSL